MRKSHAKQSQLSQTKMRFAWERSQWDEDAAGDEKTSISTHSGGQTKQLAHRLDYSNWFPFDKNSMQSQKRKQRTSMLAAMSEGGVDGDYLLKHAAKSYRISE